MAKTFFYDNFDLEGATIDAGSFSSTTYTSSPTRVTGENKIIDNTTASAVTSFTSADSIQITTTKSRTASFIALYFTGAESDNLSFNIGVAPNTFAEIIDLSTNFITGWNIFTFTETSSSNQFYLNASGTVSNLSEVLFGKTLEFELNPDLGIAESEKFGTDVNTSLGGFQYGVKRHEPIKTTTLTFSSISSTFKSSLQTMQDEIQDYKKFIYSEDGTTGPFHYVRLGKPINFKEVSVNRFSCTINLVEQLS